jgi:hypothetical protein
MEGCEKSAKGAPSRTKVGVVCGGGGELVQATGVGVNISTVCVSCVYSTTTEYFATK